MCGGGSSILHFGPLVVTNNLYTPTPNGQSPSASLNKSNTLTPSNLTFLLETDFSCHKIKVICILQYLNNIYYRVIMKVFTNYITKKWGLTTLATCMLKLFSLGTYLN